MTSVHIYNVAGLVFSVSADEALMEKMSNLEPFEDALRHPWPQAEGLGSGYLFTLEQVERLETEGREFVYRTEDGEGFPEIGIWSVKDGWLFEMKPSPWGAVASEVLTSRDFSRARVCFKGVDDAFGLNNALMLLYAFASARYGALEMHSSVVMNDGRGYMFLGRSGTGKSTHSRLWMENVPGTELLNDDNPILRLNDDGTARVYGSPWSGKTPCYRALDVPVGAVVRIEQAPENEIVGLGPLQAYASLMTSASAFRPFRELSDYWHGTLEKLAGSVPCFTLRCRPDADAARLCYGTIHG